MTATDFSKLPTRVEDGGNFVPAGRVVAAEVDGEKVTSLLPEDKISVVLTAKKVSLELETMTDLGNWTPSETGLYVNSADYERLADKDGASLRRYTRTDPLRKFVVSFKTLTFWLISLTFLAAVFTFVGLITSPPQSTLNATQANHLVSIASPRTPKSADAVSCLEQLAGVDVGVRTVAGVTCSAPETTSRDMSLAGGIVACGGAVLTFLLALKKSLGFRSTQG